MGRSASSCFKIITCSCDSVDHDDLQTPEKKGYSDRSGWGFRKRSTRLRVLSNSVISEATSSVNKENTESTAVDFQELHKSVPEKSSTDEKGELSTEVNSKLLDAVVERDDDATLDELAIILIQAAIRGFLAQRVLLKHKNIIKLQAAFRGHLVRKHAMGTLRCVQAIVKMQVLVRARHARRRVEGSNAFKKPSENCGNAESTIVVMSKNEANRNVTISIEKLLSNGFARKLSDSTPSTKPINIKCDPSKSDSAWKWLELWMSVSLMSNNELQASGLAAEQHEREEIGHPDSKDDIVIPSECTSESVGFKSSAEASSNASENADNLDLQSCRSTAPSLSQKVELPEPQNFHGSNMTCNVTDSLSIPLNETDMLPKVESKFDPGKPEREHEQEMHHDEKMFSAKQPETELSDVFDESNTTYNITNSLPIQLNQTGLLVKVEPESDPGKVEKEHEQDINHDEEKFSTKQPETEPPEPFDYSNTLYNVNNALPIQLNKTDLLAKVEPESDPLKSEREHEQDIQQDEEMFSTKQPETELPELFDESNTTYNATNALHIQLNKTDLLEKVEPVEPASDPRKAEGEYEQDIHHDEETFSKEPETEPPEPFGESNAYHVTDSSHIQLNETDLLAKVEPKSDPGKAEREHEQYIHYDEEKFSSKQPEIEEKKLLFDSRKTSNPSYIDAQLKFEELSSAAITAQLTSSTSHSPETECNGDKTDQQFGSTEVGLPENSIYQASTVEDGTPGSGTELLIASNPDSPDRSVVEAVESDPKQKIFDETNYPKSNDHLEVEADDKPSMPATDLPSINSDPLELDCGVNSSNVERASSIIPIDSPQVEKKPDADPSEMHLELGSEASHPAYKSSSEASPKSHITVSESQATPSTQVSSEFKEIRGKKTESNRESRYPSAGKGSPSNDNHDSVTSSSLEQLPMEHKTGKRRKSFGSARPDHGDQEPRDSSNSLPSYMQTTESTRAKAIANRSPRSSADMQDKDIYVKKRHSLPGGNEQQGSPRRQWSMSQAQQNSPGNGIHSPQERRWRR